MADFRQKSLDDWQAPYETNVGKLAKAHPIANVIGLGIPALAQSIAGGAGNVASIMATPDTRPAAKRIEDAVQGSNFVAGVKQVTTLGPDKMQIPVSPIIPAAQAATRALVPSIEATPMLVSHTPDPGGTIPTADQATQNAWGQAQKNRRPLANATSTVPAIDLNPGDQGQGFAMVNGQRINYRDIGTNADPLKGQGQLMTVSAGQGDQSPTGSVRPIAPPIDGDRWSYLEDGSAFGAAKAGVARKLGYVPTDYDRNTSKYDTIIAGQGPLYQEAATKLPIAGIESADERYRADRMLAANLAHAGATVEAARIGEEGKAAENRAAAQLKFTEDNEKKDAEAQKFLTDRHDYWRKYLTENPAEMEGAIANYAKIMGKDPKELTPEDHLSAQNNLIRARVMDDLRMRATGSRQAQINFTAAKLRQAEDRLKAQASSMQPGKNLPGQDALLNEVYQLRNQLRQLQGNGSTTAVPAIGF